MFIGFYRFIFYKLCYFWIWCFSDFVGKFGCSFFKYFYRSDSFSDFWFNVIYRVFILNLNNISY